MQWRGSQLTATAILPDKWVRVQENWMRSWPGRGFFPRGHGAVLCRPLPSLRVGAPRNAPPEEASLANILRDRLVSQGPSLPKPPPFPAGNDVSGCPGSAGYLGGSRLKALSSHAWESDRGYGFGEV